MGEAPHAYVEWPRPEYLPADATLPDNHPCKVCCKPRSAHAPKSAEASMKERIEELSAGVQHMHNLAHAALTKGGLEEALENIQITAHDLLFGPSDPDRERETTAEQVKP